MTAKTWITFIRVEIENVDSLDSLGACLLVTKDQVNPLVQVGGDIF